MARPPARTVVIANVATPHPSPVADRAKVAARSVSVDNGCPSRYVFFARDRPLWNFAAGGKLFAYQSGVLIVGYSYGYFAARDLMIMGAWLTIVEFLVYWFRSTGH
jgi:hypothetical protein